MGKETEIGMDTISTGGKTLCPTPLPHSASLMTVTAATKEPWGVYTL